MKTPRQAFKENFWIGAKGGLLDAKHVDAMQDAVWLFLYLLRGQTGINEHGEGIFQYGHSLTKSEICADFGGVSGETLKRWTAILKAGYYIRTEFHSSQGTTFWIAKGKHKTKSRAISAEVTTKVRAKSAPNSGGETPRSFLNSGGEVTPKFVNSSGDSAIEFLHAPSQGAETKHTCGAPETPITKGFTPTSPSYYKNTAASPEIPSFKELLRAKTPPRRMSQAGLDERRRLLLRQSEEMQAKYGKAATA